MPSRGNPNVPTSVKNRARSHKAGTKKARSRPTVVPGQPKPSGKRARKNEQRIMLARLRKQAEEEEARKEGKGGVVEMADVGTLPLSRRQKKLALRAAAVAEANAKAAAEKGGGVSKDETTGVEVDVGMDIE